MAITIEGLAPNLKYELEVIENGEIIATTANDITLESWGENRDLGDVRIDYRVK